MLKLKKIGITNLSDMKLLNNMIFNFSDKIKIKNLKNFIDNKNSKKEVLITTPIFYVNSHPHIGHLYTAILASAIKEANLIQNKKAYLSTGTDEHGLKVQQKARENNIETSEFCELNSNKFRELFDKAKINYDDYIRTTEERHKHYARTFWDKLEKENKIKSSNYSGYYSISDESFIPEKDLVQSPEGKFVTKLNQPVEFISEENFSLNFYEDNSIDVYKEHLENKKIHFQPEYIKNEVAEYINQKLFDICISRPYKRVNWGIKVPNDENHVMYVWFEALLNYLTVTHSLDLKLENLEMINLIGKDISKFHCYFWPMMLHKANKMPKNLRIVMHNHWLKSDVKMSKSIGNVVDPIKLLDEVELDAVRFYFLSSGPQNHDVNFEESTIRDIYYKYIPDTLTNLLLRLSNPKVCDTNSFNFLEEPFTKAELEQVRNLCDQVEKAKEAIISYDFVSAIHKIHMILIELNVYVHSTEYWKNLNNKNYVSKIFCTVMEFIRIVSILIKPILPELSDNINKFIGNKDSNINLNYCWFRIMINQITEIYEDEVVSNIFADVNLSEFYNQINHRENGYFKLDLAHKDKIFINKVKVEKENGNQRLNKNNNKRNKK